MSDPVKRNPLVTQSDWIEDLKDRATYLIMDEEQIVDVHKSPISGYLANPSLKAIQSSEVLDIDYSVLYFSWGFIVWTLKLEQTFPC